MGDRTNSASNTSPTPLFLSFFFFSLFLSICLSTSSHCLFTSSFIRHLSHWYEGPGQHCDMLRRQYKYLISPNGNRHSTLIAPHIIWGAVSGADIPFDPSSVSPSPLPLAHLSLSFFCLWSLFWVVCLYLPPHPSAFLSFPVSSLCSCCHLSFNAPWRLCLSRLSSSLYVCVLHVVCCPPVPCLPLFPSMTELRLNSCKGHIRTQIDVHRGPEDNTLQGNHMHTCFARSQVQLMMQHYFKWHTH